MILTPKVWLIKIIRKTLKKLCFDTFWTMSNIVCSCLTSNRLDSSSLVKTNAPGGLPSPGTTVLTYIKTKITKNKHKQKQHWERESQTTKWTPPDLETLQGHGILVLLAPVFMFVVVEVKVAQLCLCFCWGDLSKNRSNRQSWTTGGPPEH